MPVKLNTLQLKGFHSYTRGKKLEDVLPEYRTKPVKSDSLQLRDICVEPAGFSDSTEDHDDTDADQDYYPDTDTDLTDSSKEQSPHEKHFRSPQNGTRTAEPHTSKPWSPSTDIHSILNTQCTSSTSTNSHVENDVAKTLAVIEHKNNPVSSITEKQPQTSKPWISSTDNHYTFNTQCTSSTSANSHEGRDVAKTFAVSETNENNITVSSTSEKKTDGRRVWDQKDYCIFCEQFVTNFIRHIIRKHNEEFDVAKIASLPPNSAERRLLVAKLKRKGNFHHNSSVLRTGSGELVVERRPTNAKSASDYLPCELCLGFFVKDKLYKHFKKCQLQHGNAKQPGKNRVQSKGATLLTDCNEKFPELKSAVLDVMCPDKCSTAVKYDNLICQFGSRLMSRNTEHHSRHFISARMREIGRLKMNLQAKHGFNRDMNAFVKPSQYENVVKAVKEVAGYDHNTGTYQTPSLATKIGHSLRQCAEIKQCNGIRESNESTVEEAKSFIFLMEKNWQFDVSSRARKSLDIKKWNKPTMIPIASDIQALNKYIHDMEKTCRNDILENTNLHSNWRCLAEVTLGHLILLNRRRSGEVQRIHINDYNSLTEYSEQPDVFDGLSETEKMLTKTLLRLEIRGKRGRKVPLLLTKGIKANLDLILKHRENCNVLQDNPYLFGIPNSSDGCIRGSDVLRKLSNICGAKSPHLLTSTKLRKHVATVAQILNLKYKDLDQLAKFMGHNINVHSEFYRMPEATVQIAKLGKLFLALDKGNIAHLKNKTLDEIDVNIQEDELSASEQEEDDNVEGVRLCEKTHEGTKEVPNIHETSSSHLGMEDKAYVSSDEETTKPPKARTFKRRMTSKKNAWTDEEKQAVLRYLHKNILLKKVPTKSQCMNCKNEEPVLDIRSWRNIKDWVYNAIKKSA